MADTLVNPNLNNGREHRVGADLYPWEYNDTVDKKYFIPDTFEMLNTLYHRALESQDVTCAIDRFNGSMADFTRNQLINTRYGLSYNSYTLELPLYNVNFFSTLKMKRLNPRIYTMDDVCKMQDLFEQRILFFIDGKYFSKLKIYADAKRVMLVIDANENCITLDNIKSLISDGYKWTLMTVPFSASKKYAGIGRNVASSSGVDMNKMTVMSGKVQADKNFWLMGYTTDSNNTGLKDFILCSATYSSKGNFLNVPQKVLNEITKAGFVDIEVISIPNAKGSVMIGTGRYFQIAIDTNPVPPQNILLWEYFEDTNSYEYLHNSHVALYYPNVYVISDVPDDANVFVTWCYAPESTIKFDNPLKEYMDYDKNYAGHIIGGELPEIVRNYIPYVSHYNERNYLQYAAQATRWHEYPYKLSTIQELVKENPDRLKNIYERYMDRTAYDWHANPHYIIKMNEWGSYADRIRYNNHDEISVGKHEEFNGPYIYFTVDHEDDRVYPIDVWIDGEYINTSYQYTENYRTYIYIPVNKIRPYSVIDFEIIKVREENPVGIYMDLPAIHNSIAIPRGYFKDISPQNLLIAVREETSAANGGKLYIYNMASNYEMYWFLIGHTKYVNGIPMKSFEISMRGRKAVMCNLISPTVARYVYCDRVIVGDANYTNGHTFRECVTSSDHNDSVEWHYTRIDDNNTDISNGITQNDVTWKYIGMGNDVGVSYIEDDADNRPLMYGNVVYSDGTPAFDYMVSAPDKNTLHMGDRDSLLIIINSDNSRTYIYCDKITVDKHTNESGECMGYTMSCESEDGLTFQWTLLGESTWVKDGIVHNVTKTISTEKFFLFGFVYNPNGDRVYDVVSPMEPKVYAKSILVDNNDVILLQDTNTALLLDEYNKTVDEDEYFIERGFPWDAYYIVKSSVYEDYALDKVEDSGFDDPFRVIKLGYYGETRRRHFEYLPYSDNDPTIYLTPITDHFAGKRVRIQATDIYKKWVTYLPRIPRYDHVEEDRRITINDFRLDPIISKLRVFVNGRLCDFGYDCRLDVDTNNGFILGSYINIGVTYDTEDPNHPMRYLTRNSNEMVVEYLPYKYILLYRFQPKSQTVTLRTNIFKRPFSLKYYDVYVNGIKCTENDIEINTASKITFKVFISEDTTVSFYTRSHDPEVYGNRSKMLESLNDSFAREIESFRAYIQPETSVNPSSRDVANCVGCSTTCGTTCLGDCSDTCFGCTSVCTGCTGTCVSRCKNACANECGEGCVASCMLTCKNDCQGNCGIGCTGNCTGACADRCTGSCTTSCIGMSYSNPSGCRDCDTTCVGCTGNCEVSCIGTCATTCIGQAESLVKAFAE